MHIISHLSDYLPFECTTICVWCVSECDEPRTSYITITRIRLPHHYEDVRTKSSAIKLFKIQIIKSIDEHTHSTNTMDDDAVAPFRFVSFGLPAATTRSLLTLSSEHFLFGCLSLIYDRLLSALSHSLAGVNTTFYGSTMRHNIIESYFHCALVCPTLCYTENSIKWKWGNHSTSRSRSFRNKRSIVSGW